MIELPGADPKKLEAIFGQKPNYVSGGKILVFFGGWAIDIAAFGKAHYYRIDATDQARSACRLSTIPLTRLYGAGTVPRCKLCLKIRK